MEQRDVERIIRAVLTDLGAPLTLLKVQRTAVGWDVTVKQVSGRGVRSVSAPDGPPPAIRTAMIHLVEAESED